jgi:uncharacterized protein involved in exopolysaccharide biosynthesis
MEIRQVIRDVRRNIVVALGVFVLCVVIGAAAAFLPAKHYTATTLVAAQPVNAANGGGPQVIPIIVPQLPDEVTALSNLDAARARVPDRHGPRAPPSRPRPTPAPTS